MKMERTNVINYQQQQGAVLAISLILLLVITLVGVSTVGTTLLEEKMAMNSQVSNRTFQASEDAIEAALDDISYLGRAYDLSVEAAGGPVQWEELAVENDNEGLSSKATSKFLEIATNVAREGKGDSIVIGGGGGVAYYNYSVDGEAEIPAANSFNTNVQGAYIRGPAVN